MIQTVNLAPHRIGNVDAGGRPAWFWDKERYGGILTDIGSHQIEQFLYYTDRRPPMWWLRRPATSTIRNIPNFEDFGDMIAVGNGGTGYIRVDWFTPDGLRTWGDGRLFMLGTEGYIELRKYIDIAGRPGGNHLFIVDKKGIRYFDCKDVVLPFGPQFVSDILHRTETAQNQDEALLAAELVLTAQKNATAADPGLKDGPTGMTDPCENSEGHRAAHIADSDDVGLACVGRFSRHRAVERVRRRPRPATGSTSAPSAWGAFRASTT